MKREKVFYKYRVCKDLMGWQIWSENRRNEVFNRVIRHCFCSSGSSILEQQGTVEQ